MGLRQGIKDFFSAAAAVVSMKLHQKLSHDIGTGLAKAARAGDREYYDHVRNTLSGTITEVLQFSQLRRQMVQEGNLPAIASILAWDYAAGPNAIYPRSLSDIATEALREKNTAILDHLLGNHDVPRDLVMDHMRQLGKDARAENGAKELRDFLTQKGFDIDGIETTDAAIKKRRADFKPSTRAERLSGNKP